MPVYWMEFALVVPSHLVAALLILASYLCGSIPFGVLVARAKGLDIQKCGSGNIGATNVGRMLGGRFFLLVFSLDFLKGFCPTFASELLGRRLGSDPFLQFDLAVCCALAAVLGHVFSIWLRFRGGKAGATGLGVGAVICWQAMLAAAVVWLVVVGVSRYVSLGTILGAIFYVAGYVVVSLFLENASPVDRQHIVRTIFCVAVAALVIARHKDNVRRLLSGTESKTSFGRR